MDRDRSDGRDDSNPFTIFRKFADEQLREASALLRSTVQAMMPPDRSQSVHRPARSSNDDDNKYWDPWEDFNRQLGYIVAASDKKDNTAKPETHDDQDGFIPVKISFDQTPRKESLSARSHCPWIRSRRSVEHPKDPQHEPDWKVSYILHSPYSPLSLERQPEFRDSAQHWRAAFEDLLETSSGESSRFPVQHSLEREREYDQAAWALELLRRNPSPWIVPFVLNSAYSPLFLERRPDFPDLRDHWRDAFEDLVCTAEGDGKLTRPDRHSTFTTPKFPPVFDDFDWIKAMDEKATFKDDSFVQGVNAPATLYWEHWGPPSRLLIGARPDCKETRFPDDAQPAWDSSMERERARDASLKATQRQKTTRSDPYAQLLRRQDGVETAGGTKPSVVSTLTTTERQFMPDGTVETRTVLKKRFSDGREQCSEKTAHTRRPNPSNGQKNSVQIPVPENESKKAVKSGWFWSTRQ